MWPQTPLYPCVDTSSVGPAWLPGWKPGPSVKSAPSARPALVRTKRYWSMDATTPNGKTHETSPCPPGPEDKDLSQFPEGQAEAPLGVEGPSEECKVFRCPLALVHFLLAFLPPTLSKHSSGWHLLSMLACFSGYSWYYKKISCFDI